MMYEDDYYGDDSSESGSALDSILNFASKLGAPVLAAQFGPQNSGLAVNPNGTGVLPTNTQQTSGLKTSEISMVTIVAATVIGVGIFAFVKLLR